MPRPVFHGEMQTNQGHSSCFSELSIVLFLPVIQAYFIICKEQKHRRYTDKIIFLQNLNFSFCIVGAIEGLVRFELVLNQVGFHRLPQLLQGQS